MKPGVRVRATAAGLVGRVVRGGAWSNRVVRRLDLPPDDARLARYLVYGTLRNLPRLDRAIAQLAHRPLTAIDDGLLDVLRVAFHEVLFGRTADHAVPYTAVESARACGYGRAAGFVNAMVRNLQRKGEPQPPSGPAETFSLPEWLMEDLIHTWGDGPARSFAEASHEDAPVTFRMIRGLSPPSDAIPTVVDGAFYLPDGLVPSGAVVQDPSSQAVVHAVGVGSGDRVLEVGAAPGGKTLALWERTPELSVALDVHERRIARAFKRSSASGFDGYWVRADGRRLPFRSGTFDKVLVDAPCTGIGTLRRRPEIRFRVSIGDRDRLAALQRSMVEEALRVVRPGGRVIYAVCTVTSAETIEVMSGFDANPPEGLPGRRLENGLLMAPHLTGTDGMFIAIIDR